MIHTCAECRGPRLWGGSICARCGYALLEVRHPNRKGWSLRKELTYLHGYCQTGHAHLFTGPDKRLGVELDMLRRGGAFG